MKLFDKFLEELGFNNWLIKWAFKPIYSFLGLAKLEKILIDAEPHKDKRFIETIFNKTNINVNTFFLQNNVFSTNEPLIIVANHPTGLLDGLSILYVLFSENRKVKIVVNYLLKEFAAIDEALGDTFIYVNPFDKEKEKKSSYEGLKKIMESLSKKEVVVFFPAADVSKISIKSCAIIDCEWNNTCIKFIKKSNIKIIPIFTHAKNSFAFYLLNTINSKIGLFFIINEFFNKSNSTINLTIGKVVEMSSCDNEKQLKQKLINSVYDLEKYSRN